MSRLLVASLGVLLGLTALVGGVVLVFGPGWALIVGGVLLAAASLLLIDVKESDAESSPARPS